MEEALKTVSTLLVTFLLFCALTAAQNPPAQPAARTDVYHVHFAKSALGKAAQLGDALKTQLPNAPMPGHYLVLRHEQGDEWDYVAIEHLGTKVTVEAAGSPTPPAVRDLYAWHGDTFVSGPSWAEFSRAMGIGPDATGRTAGSVYVVATMRPAPGQREQLEKLLSTPPTAGAATPPDSVLLQHLEGAPWIFMTITRYNSWQDFATDQSNSVAQTNKTPGQGGWYQLRDYAPVHHDTITSRVVPAAAAGTAPR
jgi:hypothetical protein